MSSSRDMFLTEHSQLSRRLLLGLGAVGAAALANTPLLAAEPDRDPVLQEAIDRLESWLTLPDKFRDVSRGKPVPHSLPEERRQQVGMTRETWKLEVLSDADHPARIRSPLTIADGTALDFSGLMKLAEQHAVPLCQGDDVPEHRLPAR